MKVIKKGHFAKQSTPLKTLIRRLEYEEKEGKEKNATRDTKRPLRTRVLITTAYTTSLHTPIKGTTFLRSNNLARIMLPIYHVVDAQKGFRRGVLFVCLSACLLSHRLQP